jgi:hypothetical protein
LSVFAGYYRYYDLLYRDKDYAAEVRCVHDILRKHAPGVHSPGDARSVRLGRRFGTVISLFSRHEQSNVERRTGGGVCDGGRASRACRMLCRRAVAMMNFTGCPARVPTEPAGRDGVTLGGI